MPSFEIVSDFRMTGDQPQAVDKLVEGLGRGGLTNLTFVLKC
jgi:excinuclease ABC subunit B